MFHTGHNEEDEFEPPLGNDEAEEEDDDDDLLGFVREDDDEGVTNGNKEKEKEKIRKGLWNLDEAGFIAHFGRDQFLRLIFRQNPYLSAKSRYVKEIN